MCLFLASQTPEGMKALFVYANMKWAKICIYAGGLGAHSSALTNICLLLRFKKKTVSFI